MLSSSAETKFFSCPHCHSLFDGIKKLQIHSLQAHRVELSSNYSGLVSSLDSSRIDDLVPRPYACHVCGHMFVDEALRDNHVAKRHNTYFCEFCPLVFNLDSSRQVHMRKAHGARVITEDDTEDAEADHQINRFSAQHSAYQCRYCNGHFDNLENCLAHEQINHRATEDLPTVDGTNLPMSESDEETEMDGATLDKRLACEFCHRLYKNKENLKKHRRSSHAQELNEKLKLEGPTAAEIVRETCEYCGKSHVNMY